MSILRLIFDFVGKIFSNVINESLKTPAVEEEVDVKEGNAKPVNSDYYDGKYGVCDRGERKE